MSCQIHSSNLLAENRFLAFSSINYVGKLYSIQHRQFNSAPDKNQQNV